MAAKDAPLDAVVCGGDEQADFGADECQDGGGVNMSDVDEDMGVDDAGGDDDQQRAMDNPFGPKSDEAAIVRACSAFVCMNPLWEWPRFLKRKCGLGDLRCPDFLLVAYPSFDDTMQCQWSAKQLTKLLYPGDVPDEKLRKFWNKNEKAILDTHAEIWYHAGRDEDADIAVSAALFGPGEDMGDILCRALLIGVSCSQVYGPVAAQMPVFQDEWLDEITTEVPDETQKKKKVTYLGKALNIFADEPHLHDYDWSELQRAFGGIKQSWYATQQVVPGLDMQMVQQTHPDYEWYQIFTEPGELGFTATSRARTYIIGAHKFKTVCLHDPFELHDAIKKRMKEYAQTTVSDYLVATEAEVVMEAQDTGRVRNVVHRPRERDFSYYLTPREAQSKAVLDNKYRQRFHADPETDGNLVYNLGDNADWNTSWSACSGAVPTFRLGSSTAKFWLPKYRRWLTCREKLVAMGFPVTAECAEALGTPAVFVSDVRSSQLCGVWSQADKRTQCAQLKNEYLRLGQPMQECSLLDLVRRVEIEFSRDKVFDIGRGAGNSWLVLCGDQFRKLPNPESEMLL
ncbi:hypothetical protein AK812_SmicGene44254 [Symbiodinium microadriaticum]|uniref:Uncharacterized protein n=1 Tax=Symbiodinium microadriaticum TaxID=2951 RepID=A0A1Q9BYX9_SYMMI|nr:hypothetical protein AK812_SmicGene44254 [Symbiodinium microadriaticum]